MKCIASFHVLHFSEGENCFLRKGMPSLRGNYFEELESFQQKGHTRQIGGRLSFIKECMEYFQTISMSCNDINSKNMSAKIRNMTIHFIVVLLLF